MKIQPENVLDVLKKNMLVDGYDLVIDLKNSKGNILVDARNGDEYLDFFSFFASNPLGYNHPKMMTDEFKEKLLLAATQKPSNSDFYTVEMAEFVATFFEKMVPENSFKYIFMIEGGALAVENALKTAFDWKVRKNFAKGFKEERGKQILHFQQAFHGRTGYTLSLTNTADPRKTKYFPKFDWPRVLNPKLTFPETEENLQKVKQAEQESLNQIKTAIRNNPDDIAAIIIEPIQGEGGDNHFRKEFLQDLRQICDESDILLIFDEVQTGVGITGKWWAFEHFDVVPDILCFGKKTQVCGILATDRVEEVKNHVFQESSRINSTWGGNLVDMVRATRYFEVIDEDQLVKNAAETGVYLRTQLQELAAENSRLLTNVRGRGFFVAFDVNPAEKRGEIIKESLAQKMIVLPSGIQSVRFRPSLITTREDIDQAVMILKKVIQKIG